jgi:hypothetical protein
MFRKKQKKSIPQARNVQPSNRAPVFSYYANRSTAETVRGRGEAAAERSSQLTLKRWVGYAPSLIAGMALVFCLGYASTLSADPNIQVVGQAAQVETLVADLSSYQDDFKAVLTDSPFNRSKLFINTDNIAQEVSKRHPELGEISVVLPLVGRRPVFKVRPAEPAITLSASGGPYVVDTKGRVLAYTRDTNSSITEDLPIVRDESGLPVERGNSVITNDTIRFITLVAGQLTQAKINPEALILPQTSAGELHLRLEGKPYFVKFDMRGQGRLQAGTLIAVKEHLEQQGKTPAEYIDVRVPEKAFYK